MPITRRAGLSGGFGAALVAVALIHAPLEAWGRGFGGGWRAGTLAEAASPSGAWQAAVRQLVCSAPGGSSDLEVTLVPTRGVASLWSRTRILLACAAPDPDEFRDRIPLRLSWVGPTAIAV